MKVCNCNKKDYVLCTPTALSREDARLLKANREYIGKFVCNNCGGIWPHKNRPKKFMHVMGGTIMSRLVELGIVTNTNGGEL